MNPDWLKAKTFGMPRWTFLVLLAGGVAVGLYLRSRRSTVGEQTPPVAQPALDEFQDVADPGLAGVGVASPPGGVYPVSQPILPEGFTDVVASLTSTIAEQANQLGSLPSAIEQPPPPVINVTAPATGGGPPSRPASHGPAPASPKGTHAEYLRQLRAIRDRHGAGSKEVQNYRNRHPDQLA
jgi:hypothetical protein